MLSNLIQFSWVALKWRMTDICRFRDFFFEGFGQLVYLRYNHNYSINLIIWFSFALICSFGIYTYWFLTPREWTIILHHLHLHPHLLPKWSRLHEFEHQVKKEVNWFVTPDSNLKAAHFPLNLPASMNITPSLQSWLYLWSHTLELSVFVPHFQLIQSQHSISWLWDSPGDSWNESNDELLLPLNNPILDRPSRGNA